jgi:DNA (cytosine-5)-methyltransferase 1
VADLLHRGLGTVLGDLATLGYDAEWHCIPASYVGLPQARERVWIIAYPYERGRISSGKRHKQGPLLVLRTDDDRLGEAQAKAKESSHKAWGNDDGLPGWVDGMRGFGNAVVPQIPELIGRAILMAENRPLHAR